MPEPIQPSLPELAGLDLAEIARLVAERRLPPVETWNPPHCGHSAMRIAADGGWWHEGAPIARPAMVRLFASVLRRDADGGYVLVTPVEKLAIDVDDLPFLATELASKGDGRSRRLAFRTDLGDLVVAGPDHPLTIVDGRPSVRVRGGLDARLSRPVHYELAELALAEDAPGLWSDGVFFRLDGGT